MNRREFLGSVALGAVGARAALVAAAVDDGLGVLVTADLDSHVALVAPAAATVLARIPTPVAPRSIERLTASTALVAHSESGRLTVIDATARTAQVLAQRLGEPRYTAVHPSGRFAYVSDSGRQEVAVFDVSRRAIVGRVAVGGPARHITVSPDGRWLWTALGTKARRIAILDLARPTRPRLAASVTPPFLAHDVVAAPGGREVWVSSGDRERLAIVDLRTRRVRRQLEAGAAPQHIAFAPSGVAYVASGDDGTMRTHAPDGQVLRTVPIPLGSYNVTRDTGIVVSPSLERGTVAVLDAYGRRRRTVSVTRSAHDAAIVRL